MVAILIIHGLAITLAWLCSSGGVVYAGIPVFAWCALWIFALQWLAFVPAYLRQTEKYYDLMGSVTYITSMLLALGLSGADDLRSFLLASVVFVWAGRLGTFLFSRIQQDGHDSRFDKIKPNPVLFFRTWSLQGLWVLVTAAAALAAISGAGTVPIGPVELLGLILWLVGFVIEVVADSQKRRFREANGAGVFINTGLWARSRHPNYFGEILLWFGVAVMAFPALQGLQYAALISPVFVFVLLTRISGIPLLERKSDRRWGDDPAYVVYKQGTPILVPRLF